MKFKAKMSEIRQKDGNAQLNDSYFQTKDQVLFPLGFPRPAPDLLVISTGLAPLFSEASLPSTFQ
ncbi:hypothetical protein MUG84_19640 [Paenibacillus sp. KQZ6P-2]|uniref:Uncharacterized protein n=1 Tax=Paenibacillus mangrovi TaxID=2931978 RepID=A0A9X1WRW7_9BACL|nr:hypothetical protein [Paenibacillus mangrovi]MCJ8013944.1 hypothetical protein [Paenibacillus mangrovi]